MQNQVTSLLPLLFFIVLMYFLFIRPQQREQKKRREMLNALKEGDKVVTAGGMHAVITKVKDDSLLVRIAPNVEVELQKSGVAYLVKQ
ncbi:MAG: preprotein translocase subunit YajC [Firmicutes bacterium]|jgi:preprotein translocase subunit YajC|nr:preprotein translocase subunit YajC [Bacillota bacterium]